MKRNCFQKIMFAGVVLTGVLLLVGCQTEEQRVKKVVKQSYKYMQAANYEGVVSLLPSDSTVTDYHRNMMIGMLELARLSEGALVDFEITDVVVFDGGEHAAAKIKATYAVDKDSTRVSYEDARLVKLDEKWYMTL